MPISTTAEMKSKMTTKLNFFKSIVIKKIVGFDETAQTHTSEMKEKNCVKFIFGENAVANAAQMLWSHTYNKLKYRSSIQPIFILSFFFVEICNHREWNQYQLGFIDWKTYFSNQSFHSHKDFFLLNDIINEEIWLNRSLI